MKHLKYPIPVRSHGLVVVRFLLALIPLLGLASCGQSGGVNAPPGPNPITNAAPAAPTVELSAEQLNAIQIAPVGTFRFPEEKEAVGSIDFDEDRLVQVFPSYQGKLLQKYAGLGDTVQKEQPLYSIDSPDLVQAESTLIGAAATFELTDKELARAKFLNSTNVGVSQRELEQAVNDQQTAEGALKAARDALRVFGKTDAEIDQIVATRKIDPALIVRSPIAGQITALSAPPGCLVQPGNPPAPFSVADPSSKWMLGNVNESDCPLLQVGQPVEAKVMAYPDRVFTGKVDKVYETVDSNVHTETIRSEIADPDNELRPGMLATFVIQVHPPLEATALPAEGVVRESDGTMTAWVTSDRRHFTQRIIKTGMRKNGEIQIVEGLQRGELAVTTGAVFLSNMLNLPPSD